MLIWAKFKRKTPGEAVYAPKGTKIFLCRIILKINENADINVIFTGTNGVWNAEDKSGEDYADDLVILIRKNARKDEKNPDKYIIIGLTTRARDDWKNHRRENERSIRGTYCFSEGPHCNDRGSDG
ncbi:MAG: hypothetical protein L6V93_14840 [Clostridiales bacterium]|nr:MAG: hypothetical protein L6V93_14840 [Clostridiales bacterium]